MRAHVTWLIGENQSYSKRAISESKRETEMLKSITKIKWLGKSNQINQSKDREQRIIYQLCKTLTAVLQIQTCMYLWKDNS